jgi:hypothetical protein
MKTISDWNRKVLSQIKMVKFNVAEDNYVFKNIKTELVNLNEEILNR